MESGGQESRKIKLEVFSFRGFLVSRLIPLPFHQQVHSLILDLLESEPLI